MNTSLLRASRLLSLFIIFSLSCSVFTSCKDDDEFPQLGTLTVEGTSHSIDDGTIIRDKKGELSSITEAQIYFHRISLAGPNDVGFSFTVVSNGIELEADTYEFQEHQYNHQYLHGELYDAGPSFGPAKDAEATDGTVTIVKNGNSYSIEGTATVDGRLFVVSFNGEMQIL